MNLAEFVLSRYWAAAGVTMLHYLWVGALLGLLSAIVRAAVKPQPATLRYYSALGCLALQAVAPIAIYLLVLSPSIMTDPRARVPAGQPAIAATAPLATAAASPEGEASSLLNHTPTAAGELTLPQRMAPQLSMALPWLWLGGSTLMLTGLLTGVIGSQRLCRTVHCPAGKAVQRRCQRIARSLRISRKVAIGVSDRIVAPVVIGIWRPTILLPLSVWSGFTPAQLEMILWHELAHVRRYDNLMNFLERVLQSLLFFQPAVWFTCHWVRFERENCCDAVALNHASSPRAYAETLASLAVPGFYRRVSTASSANHQLVARVRYILRTNDAVAPLSQRIGPWLVALMLGTTFVAAVWAQGTGIPVGDARPVAWQIHPAVAVSEVPAARHDEVKSDRKVAAAAETAAAVPPTEASAIISQREASAAAAVSRPATSSQQAEQTSPSAEQLAASTAVPSSGQSSLASQTDTAVRQQEDRALAEIKRLGGWATRNGAGHVEEVNLAYYDAPEGRHHNDLTAHSDEGLRKIDAFPHLKRLFLYKGQATDDALAAIARLQELEIISSWSTLQVSDEGVRHLADLQNLREVYFDAGRLGDGALAVFGQLPRLEVLRMLIGNEVTDAGLKHLATAGRLRELAIGQGRYPITDAGVEHLMQLTSLENLNVQDSRISPAGVARLMTLPQLRVLRINQNEYYERHGGVWLAKDG